MNEANRAEWPSFCARCRVVDGFARWLVLDQKRDRKEEEIAELGRVGA